MQAGKDELGLLVQSISVLVRQISQSSRQVDEILCFRQGAASDVKKIQIIPFALAGCPLDDIRRYGIGGTAQLAGQAIHFFSGE